MERLFSLFGLLVFLGIAWALSTNRRAIRLRTILWGLGLQFALALFVLKVPIGQELFSWVGARITRLLNLSYVGSDFVFGALGIQGGGQLPVRMGEANGTAALGFVFAFQILPTIIFVAALFAILYHLGVMQVIVKAVAKVIWCDLAAKEAWGEHRYGVEFQSFSKGSLDQLKLLLKEVGETLRGSD